MSGRFGWYVSAGRGADRAVFQQPRSSCLSPSAGTLGGDRADRSSFLISSAICCCYREWRSVRWGGCIFDLVWDLFSTGLLVFTSCWNQCIQQNRVCGENKQKEHLSCLFFFWWAVFVCASVSALTGLHHGLRVELCSAIRIVHPRQGENSDLLKVHRYISIFLINNSLCWNSNKWHQPRHN